MFCVRGPWPWGYGCHLSIIIIITMIGNKTFGMQVMSQVVHLQDLVCALQSTFITCWNGYVFYKYKFCLKDFSERFR